MNKGQRIDRESEERAIRAAKAVNEIPESALTLFIARLSPGRQGMIARFLSPKGKDGNFVQSHKVGRPKGVRHV